LDRAGVVFGGADLFSALEAEGVDEGVGHVGEDRGAMSADAVVASEGDEFGDEGADLMDFSDLAEFGASSARGSGGGAASARLRRWVAQTRELELATGWRHSRPVL